MKTWDVRKTIGAVVVAAAIAGCGGAAIAAAADSGFHGFSGGMPGGAPPPQFPTARRADDRPESVHAEYVVADGRGGFSTLTSQTGRVTAISPTSVTARSDDGFVATYGIREVGGASAPPFAVGDRVTIDATREGEALTVTTIRPPLASGH